MQHSYGLNLVWQGNRGTGTSGYRDYDRQVLLTADGKSELLGSADPMFRGDASRWNPEELLLAALALLAQCHLLSYLHSAVTHGVVVTAYTDSPVGTMAQAGQGGRFTSVVVRPRVTVSEASMVETARDIHREASRNCFIAASVNFPVTHEPQATVAS